ncbi:glucokinase [Phenylobacterium sp.]|uniref:glucokinase n=1 Tax=Phenylobacterium sp. TaxID=1871053 RepID=UPI00289E11F2|nr:glucokinase [Phenylobacterium sp.]
MRRDASFALVGDIGGTNARFAVADLQGARPSIVLTGNVLCKDHASLAAAADAFLMSADLAALPATATIAVAGPVADGAARLTNAPWDASEAELMTLGFTRARLVNDFEALATGVAELAPEDSLAIGPDLPGLTRAPVVIAGAGTGFGLAALVWRAEGPAQVVASEGGHAGFAPVSELEIEIARALARRHGRVSIERLLSGPGLQALYAILAEIEGKAVEPEISSEEVAARARAGGDSLCVGAVEVFCAVFGSVSGDAALTFGARGGVYLAGGLVEGVEGVLTGGTFRQRFEAKGRLSSFVEAIPTRLVVQPHTALLGAARIARRLSPQAFQMSN